MGRIARRGLRLLAGLIALLAALPASAHNVPNDATVKVFVKPQGQTLRLLVRMPLKGVSELEYPRRPGGDQLDLSHIDPVLHDAAVGWVAGNLQVYEGDRLLPAPQVAATRLSLESDPAFASYEAALTHLHGPPLPTDTSLFWEQGLLDVELDYPIRSERSAFSLHPTWRRLALRVVTAIQFLPPGGAVRAYELDGDEGLVRLDPSWSQAASRFVAMGFQHILSGTDHLLFLLCLVIPFRRVRPLVGVVTAFTVAHSITLIASAYGYAPDALWFPPLIETLIAASILYMALENILVAEPARRWVITFLFGLVHGFGFSFVLQRTLQFSGSHMLLSLLSFNVGVELGQLLVLILAAPLLALLLNRLSARRLGVIVLSALVAHVAWHWMTERYDILRQFPTFQFTPREVLAGVAVASILAFLGARRSAGRAAAQA